MNRKTILVTGAGGFTGQHFIHAAQNYGYDCIALVQNETQKKTNFIPDAHIVSCDLLNVKDLEAVFEKYKPNFVVHLAAISFVEHGALDEMYLTNIVASINLLDTLIKFNPNVEKVIIASSANIYGNSESLPIKEDAELKPQNDYAVSKCAMEIAIQLRTNSLPLIITRPFNYTGRGQAEAFLIPKLVTAFTKKQNKIELGNLDVSRDYTDVRDLVNAYLLLLKSEEENETFNICSGKSISLKNIIAELQVLSGHTLNVVSNPKFVRKNDILDLYGSDMKLKNTIGEYRKYTIKETLEWMLL